MKLDILYNRFGVRVASRVAERLKTQNLSNLGNIREFRIRVETQSSTTPSRNYTLAIAVKKHGKENINLFLSRPVLMGFSILFQIFSSGLSINRKKTENKKKSKAKKQKKTKNVLDVLSITTLQYGEIRIYLGKYEELAGPKIEKMDPKDDTISLLLDIYDYAEWFHKQRR